MVKEIALLLRTQSRSEAIRFRTREVVCAGYAGRDQRVVRKHVEELAKMGVPAPSITPVAYSLPSNLLTTASRVKVDGPHTSGEVEFVVLFDGEKRYVTVGSDHTNRLLEKTNVQRSKEVCPKVIGKEVWRYDELRPHWDKIRFRSSVVSDGREEVYQEGTFGDIMTLDALSEALKVGAAGTALFCGTIPTKKGEIVYSGEFHMELDDPVLGRKIEHDYSVQVRDNRSRRGRESRRPTSRRRV